MRVEAVAGSVVDVGMPPSGKRVSKSLIWWSYVMRLVLQATAVADAVAVTATALLVGAAD